MKPSTLRRDEICESPTLENLREVRDSCNSSLRTSGAPGAGGLPEDPGEPRPLARQRLTAMVTAFTRLDLLAVLAGAALLAALAVPLAAGSRPRGERIACMNNLRQVGQGFSVWVGEHGNLLPWRLPYTSGGTRFHPLVDNAWLHVSWISNELKTASILTCPSDTPRKVATDFSANPDGLLYGGNRNNSLSYFLGLDAMVDFPQHWLSGDRNLRHDGTISRCSSGVSLAPTIYFTFPGPVNNTVGWTNGVHWYSGNVLYTDGRVEELSSDGFRRSGFRADDNGSVHLLIP